MHPGLDLLVLGSDGSWPGPGGACSGYVVSDGATTLLFDAGPGSFAILQEHVDPASIDAVVISHEHPDHWTDLNGIATHARFALGGRDLPVYGPSSLIERSGLSDNPTLKWHQVTGGDERAIGGIDVTFRRTDHGPETLAVRIEGGGRRVGYSADTGPNWSAGELGMDLDLLICEATFTADFEGTPGHLSGRQAGEQARQAGATRLVITHRWPTLKASEVASEAAHAFEGAVEEAGHGKLFAV